MHLILDSAWLKALGWSLISSLWQMAILWLIYMLVAPFLRARSASRHGLAIALMLTGSGWFLISFISACIWGVHADFLFSNGAMLPLQYLYNLRSVLLMQLPLISFAYLGVLCLLFTRYIRFYRYSKNFKSTGLQKAPATLRLFVSTVATRMGIRKETTLWLSSIVQTPMTVGFWKPVILVPVAMINHLSVQQVESVLLHELAHIKRNDYLLNLVIAIMEIGFFFNPFARLLSQNIRKEREHCCDDLVMQFQYDPLTYASALLSLEKNRMPELRLVMAAIGRDRQLLLERIRRVSGQGRFAPHFDFRVIALFLLTLITSAILFIKVPNKTSHATFVAYRAFNGPGRDLLPVRFASADSKQPGQNPVAKTVSMQVIYKKNEKATVAAINVKYTPEEGDEADANDVTINNASLQPEARDYSIAVAPPPPPAPVPGANGGNYPYVPNSSYSYKITTDDSISVVSAEQLQTLVNIQKTVNTIDALETENTAVAKVTVDKLQDEVNRSFKAVNWEQVNEEAIAELPENERKIVLNEVHLQIRNLQRAIRQSPIASKQLQKKLLDQQVKLQQLNRKQIQIIQAKPVIVHI